MSGSHGSTAGFITQQPNPKPFITASTHSKVQLLSAELRNEFSRLSMLDSIAPDLSELEGQDLRIWETQAQDLFYDHTRTHRSSMNGRLREASKSCSKYLLCVTCMRSQSRCLAYFYFSSMGMGSLPDSWLNIKTAPSSWPLPSKNNYPRCAIPRLPERGYQFLLLWPESQA